MAGRCHSAEELWCQLQNMSARRVALGCAVRRAVRPSPPRALRVSDLG
jgi:hypothetical protein